MISSSTVTAGGQGNGGGSMNNFTGTIIISSTNSDGVTPTAGTFRFNNGGGTGSGPNFGNVNATFDLGQGSVALSMRNRGTTVNLGALKGGPNTSVTAGTTGSGTVTYSIGGNNTSTTYAGKIVNSSTVVLVTKVGTGILTLTGPNTYTGATTISGGTLQIGDGVTTGAGQLGTANVTDNGTLEFARPDAISIATVISGTGNVVQAGPNTLTLTGANTYTGATIVTNGGTLIVGAAGAVSSGTALTLGGAGTAGTLDLVGNSVTFGALNTGSGATGATIGSSGSSNPTILTITTNASGPSAFSGVIQDTLPGGSGVLALALQGGKLTLTGANTYSGSTTVSNSTLVLGAGGSIASSTIILAGAGGSVLDASAVGGINLSSGAVLAASGGVNGNVTAANCLITPGTNGTVATLTCSNNLTLNGGVTVNFDLSSAPASGNDQVLVGGALNLSGLNTIQISPLTLCGVGTYRLFVCGSVSGTGANLQLAGSPGNGLNAALNVTGTEVDLVVTAVAPSFTWHGDGSLNQWDYTTSNWLTNGVAALYSDGDFTLFNNTGSTTPAINITAPVAPASVTVNASVNYTFGGSGKITGVGSLTKTNTGTLILTTPNDYTGGTTINQGTIQVSDGSTAGATLGNGGVVDNASLVFDEPDGYDFTNVISGKGTLTQAGSGTMTFSGNNTYSGTTTISAGTLQVGDGTTTGTLGTNTVTDNAALAFNPNSASSVVQSGLVTGNGTLTVLGGTVAVTAANNYSGTTTINSGGTLQLGNGGATGSVPAANITDNGTLAFDHSVNEANTTAITGSGGINKLGVNILTMNAANTYTGNTVISGGTVKIGAAGTIPSGSGFGNVDLDGGASAAGILDLNGFDTILNGINGTNNTVLGMVVNNSGTAINALNVGAGDATTAFSGLIEDNTGTGGRIELIKSGAGTFTLGGTNTYSGGTIISNGVLALGSNQANTSGLGASNVIFRGGTLQLFGFTGSNGNHYNSPTNPLVVLAGQTGTLQLFQRGPTDNTGITAPLTGGGTLNLVVSFTRASIDGDWSAFTGLINVTSSSGTQHFRTKDTYGYANAAIYLNSGVIMYDNGNANATIDIGELGGTTGASLGYGTVSQNNAVANPTWRIGAKNTTNTFAGNIINDGVTSITKIGTGTLYLSGQNTYSGSTTISNGTLALTNGVNGDGTIANSTNIFINAGAVLDVSGENTPTLTLGSTQTIGGSGTLNGALDTTSGATITPGTGATGTLTVTNTIAFGGNINIAVDHAITGATNASLAAASITIPSSATLNVNQGTNDLVMGDTFKLFKIGDSSVSTLGSLTVNLPGSSPDSVYTYTWDTSQLGVNGTITLTSGAPSTPPAPVAGFSGTPTSGIAPLNVAFTDASSGSITNWIWNFGDGNSVTNSSSVSVNHSYAAGTYNVSLTVNGAGGSSLAMSNNYIVVTAAAPVAGFTATPTNIFVTQTVAFTDASTGSITNWVWNFGDGVSVTNTSNAGVNHTYNTANAYTASLTVNGAGGSSSATRNIVVKPRPVLNKPVLSGSNLILSGVNGPAGQQYRILSTTNVALPLAGWTPVYTNTFNADGSYGYTNSTLVNKADFLLLVSP